MSNSDTPSEAPLFANGTWSTTRDEFFDAWTDELTHVQALHTIEFEQWTRIGDPEAVLVPITVDVYLRPHRAPHGFIQLQGNASGQIPHFFAQTIADTMDLLAQWMPAAQSAAVTDLLRQLNDPDHAEGQALTTIGRLVYDITGVGRTRP